MLKTLTAAAIALHVAASAATAADRHISLKALYAAFAAGDLETVMAFKAKDLGTDFIFFGPYGMSLVHSAAQHNQPAIAAALIDDGLPVDIRTKPPEGQRGTPIMVSAGFCSLQAGLFFLDAGAEVNAVHGTGSTALIFAARNDCPEMVSLLLDHDADPMIAARGRKLPKDERGFRAVDFARKYSPELLETRAGKRLVALTEAGEGCDGGTVERGDSHLGLFAERILGDAERWREIAKLNGIGPDSPARYGDCLKLPA
ncbi:MAG: ankyrin repeat domain-containing protein [Boseongicola sp. SB0675_bin_26]|nr:ankyrin repeat domain-containing protein [Boseongicola sp. SB0675_bin_26]